MGQRRIRTFLSCLILLLGIALPAAAQYVPEVNYPIHQDVSPPVRGLNGHAVINVENNAPFRMPLKATNPQFDPVVQNTVGPSASAPAGTSFDGVAVGAPGCNCAPPDTEMAVGPNHIVQWVNTDWAVFDKTGVMQAGYPKAGNSFWTGFGGDCESHNNGDPIMQYDRIADRWLATQFALNTPFGQNYQCVAVSVTNDPGGSYYRYQYAEPYMPDYPKASVWPVAYAGAANGAYFFSFNMFQFGQFFQGPRACAYDRGAMLNGAAASEVCFQLSSANGSILSTDLDGVTLPAPATPNFYFDFGTNVLLMWKFTPNFLTPSASTFTGPSNIPVAAFTAACGGGGTCVPQSETTQQLDTLADRLMYRNAYRNFGDHDAVVINHSVDASGSVGVRWYEIRNPNGTATVYQQGTFAPDSTYRWMGSIATDQAGNIGVGYSASSSSMHPAIRYTGRESTDPLNTLQAETTMFQGGGSEASGLSRWGDYSATRIDPSDDCTFWYTTEYIPANGTFNWHTRIGSFKFNSCGVPPSPPTAPSGLLATAVNAHRVDLAWTDNSNNESGFNIYRCNGDSTVCTLPTSFSKIATASANAVSYSDTSAQPASTYTYHVTAFNSAFESAPSNDSTATTPASNPPNGDPSNLTATAVSSSQINLAWTSGSTNQDGFAIERCTGTACTNFAEIARTAGTTYNNTGLSPNTSYSYRVRAFNGDGYSNYSNTANATTFDVPPAAPSGLTATGNKSGNSPFVDLKWTDNSNNETNFVVERCTGAGCTNFLPINSAVPANSTTYHDTGVARRTTYVYRVKAHNAQGDSAYSNTATATTK